MTKVSVIVPVYNVENYIFDMLKSVQNQTFKDYEVIIINDGSTDKSQTIIDQFCDTDKRFKSFEQSNSGVSASRNKGIELASGQYVVFYDPDDYIPRLAMEKMYLAATSNDADIVIGIMEEKNLGETLRYMNSQKLAGQRKINPTDEHFIRAWSVCNKMFSLDFIRKNGLKFEKLHNAEDGVFTYCALNCTDKITGCNTVSYNYVRRPFWLDASATQTVSSEYFGELLNSHDRIIEEATKLSEKIESADKRKEYLQTLYFRFLDVEMLNAYYRRIWQADSELLPLLEQRANEYRNKITEEQWQRLTNNHKDLQLEKGFMTIEEIANNPVVSILVTADVSADKLNMILGSIYNQGFPRFEVLVSKSNTPKIEEAYKNKLNFKVIENDDSVRGACEQTKGKYILIFDEFAILTKNTLRLMVSKLEDNPKLGMATILIKNFDGNEHYKIPVLDSAYGYTKSSKRRFTTLTNWDIFFFNKLFRKSALESFEFTENSQTNVMMLYKNLNFEKIRKGSMITYISQEDIFERKGDRPSEMILKLSQTKNRQITNATIWLKKHLTREDVEKLKKKFRK